MKKIRFIGLFGLVLLAACGSDGGALNDPSRKTSDDATRASADSFGCSSSKVRDNQMAETQKRMDEKLFSILN